MKRCHFRSLTIVFRVLSALLPNSLKLGFNLFHFEIFKSVDFFLLLVDLLFLLLPFPFTCSLSGGIFTADKRIHLTWIGFDDSSISNMSTNE